MKTESTIDTRHVPRTATLRLVRTQDLEAIAEANGGSITTEMLREAGDFEIVILPNGRGATESRLPVEDELSGRAWLAGFEACAALKSRGPRKPKSDKPNGKKPATKSKTTTKRATK